MRRKQTREETPGREVLSFPAHPTVTRRPRASAGQPCTRPGEALLNPMCTQAPCTRARALRRPALERGHAAGQRSPLPCPPAQDGDACSCVQRPSHPPTSAQPRAPPPPPGPPSPCSSPGLGPPAPRPVAAWAAGHLEEEGREAALSGTRLQGKEMRREPTANPGTSCH